MRAGRAGLVVTVVAALPLVLAAGPAGGEPSDEAALEALLGRLWLASELAPGHFVRLLVRNGVLLNAVASARAIAVSREYLRWTSRVLAAERERIPARTLAHELAHLSLGVVVSPGQELAAEALGIRYLERAGFDCRWWVHSVRDADETAGRPGWPALQGVIAHDAEACARARASLAREATDEAP